MRRRAVGKRRFLRDEWRAAVVHFASYDLGDSVVVSRCGTRCFDGSTSHRWVRELSKVNCSTCSRLVKADIVEFGAPC